MELVNLFTAAALAFCLPGGRKQFQTCQVFQGYIVHDKLISVLGHWCSYKTTGVVDWMLELQGCILSLTAFFVPQKCSSCTRFVSAVVFNCRRQEQLGNVTAEDKLLQLLVVLNCGRSLLGWEL